MKQTELVAMAMKATGATSRYKLAQVCGISDAHLTHYANGKRWPDNNHARLLAEAAGMNPLEVIAELEMAKAEDEATRSAWGKALASFRSKALVLLLAAVAAWSSATAPVQSPAWLLLLIVLTIMFIM